MKTWYRNEWLILAGILLVGAGLRISYLHELAAQPDFDRPIDDMQYHDYWARGLVTGVWTPPEGYPDPQIPTTSYVKPPGYPLFLALIYYVSGISYLAVRIIQMAMGLASAVLALLLARWLFGHVAGLITAALMSVYWVFIYFEGELLTPATEVFLCLLLVDSLVFWRNRTRWPRALAAGIVLGLLIVDRTNMALFVPVILGWACGLLYLRGEGKRVFSSAALLLCGVMLPIAPITIRNYAVSKEFVLISSSNLGYNLHWGNNETANGIAPLSEYMERIEGHGLWNIFCQANIVEGLEQELGKEHITYAESSKYFLGKALEYIKGHPRRTIKLLAKKAYLFWAPKEIDSNKIAAYDKQISPTLRWIPGFPLVLGLFLAGVAMLFFDLKAAYGRAPLSTEQWEATSVSLLILALIGLYYASFLPFIVLGRYRVTIIPFLLVFGAYGLWRMGQFLHTRDFRRAARWAVVGGGLYAVCSIQFIPYEPNLYRWHIQHAESYEAKSDWDRAIQEYQAALSLNETPSAHDGLGCLLIRQGKLDPAVAQFAQSLRLDPNDKYADYHWGRALAMQGNAQEARERFREAVRKNPNLADAHNSLAVVLANLGQYEDAFAEYSEALRLSPRSAPIRNNLGNLYTQTGKPGEAIAQYRAALEIDPRYSKAYNNLGLVLAGQRRYEEAAGQYEQALRIDPQYVRARLNLAAVLAAADRTDEAVKEYLEAIRLDPTGHDGIQARIDVAIVLVRQGKLQDAADQLLDAIRIDPNKRDAYFNVGVIMTALGKFDEAIGYYDKALAIDPNDTTVREHLNRARAAKEAKSGPQ